MKERSESSTWRARRRQRGQVLPIVALWMVFLLGMAAIVVDLGNVYVIYRQLQSATDAAALAGAAALPLPAANPITYATNFSAVKGNLNSYPGLTATMGAGYPKLECLTTLKNQGIACTTNSVNSTAANAVSVQMKASVPLYFAQVLGLKTMNIQATSTAAMRGASNGPFNIVVIVDTTASMAQGDGGSLCSGSRLSCALSGVQIFLQDLSPCSSNVASCSPFTSGQATNPVDEVSLMVFPAVTSASAPSDYCTGKTALSVQPYATAESPATYPLPAGPTPNTYQIVPFSSDYRTSDSATTLNPTSDLVLAVGGASGCGGLQDPGGASTYYAGVIYAAQAALVAQQATRPGSQNVMIILSDGDAEASAANGDFTGGNINGNGTGTLKNGLGTYMSSLDECQQAVIAAQAATAAGTSVYSVSYGSESTGCSTDTTNLAPLNMKGITPCQTMQNIASDATQFFSDYQGGGGSGTCVSAAQPTSNLNQIFGFIASDLTHARLIPNSTT